MYEVTPLGPWVDLDEVCAVNLVGPSADDMDDIDVVEIVLKNGRAIGVPLKDGAEQAARYLVRAWCRRDDPDPQPRALS